MNRPAYGFDNGDVKIEPPNGWVVLPEGREVPRMHREYFLGIGWSHPRNCHSTMTAITSRIWGHVQAYAVPEAHAMTDGEYARHLEVKAALKALDEAQSKVNRLVDGCHHRVIEQTFHGKPPVVAECRVCMKYLGRYCPDASDHVCIFEDDEGGDSVCIFCGEPEDCQ